MACNLLIIFSSTRVYEVLCWDEASHLQVPSWAMTAMRRPKGNRSNTPTQTTYFYQAYPEAFLFHPATSAILRRAACKGEESRRDGRYRLPRMTDF